MKRGESQIDTPPENTTFKKPSLIRVKSSTYFLEAVLGYLWIRYISSKRDALCDLVQLVQFKKREKHT